MAPWSNRIPGGRLRFGGLVADLPVNGDDGSAIHGLVAACPWQVLEGDPGAGEVVAPPGHGQGAGAAGSAARSLGLGAEVGASASLRQGVEVEQGPYRIWAEQLFVLRPGSLDLTLSILNHGEVAVPAGLGIHPWFRAGVVRLSAEQRWPGEPLPTGSPVPVDGRYDLRDWAVPEPMDTCFTGLTERHVLVGRAAGGGVVVDAAAGAGATASGDPDAGSITLGWEGPVTNVVVFSGVPGWVCVEPVTMPNGGFDLEPQEARAHGVRLLNPDGGLEVGYRFSLTV